jgi:hypothetical protein
MTEWFRRRRQAFRHAALLRVVVRRGGDEFPVATSGIVAGRLSPGQYRGYEELSRSIGAPVVSCSYDAVGDVTLVSAGSDPDYLDPDNVKSGYQDAVAVIDGVLAALRRSDHAYCEATLAQGELAVSASAWIDPFAGRPAKSGAEDEANRNPLVCSPNLWLDNLWNSHAKVSGHLLRAAETLRAKGIKAVNDLLELPPSLVAGWCGRATADRIRAWLTSELGLVWCEFGADTDKGKPYRGANDWKDGEVGRKVAEKGE